MLDEPIIDCDVHCAVPDRRALYPYLPEHWREYMETTHYSPSPAIANTFPRWSPSLKTAPATLEEVQEGALDAVTLAVLNCYFGVESYSHPYLSAALAEAVNRWLQEEWLDRDARLLAGASVAPQHLTQAVAETRRIASDDRFVQINVPVRSGLPYGDESYWPLWEAAADAGLAVAIHYGGAATHPESFVGWIDTTFEAYVNASTAFQAQIASLVFSGVFRRIPNLRFVVCESGWTWVPWLMWKVDQEWRAFRREVPWVTQAPSDYIRRHFRFTSQPSDSPHAESSLVDVVEQLGSEDLLVYASDFPHRYSEDGAARVLKLLDGPKREKMLWSTAAALYGLDEVGRSASSTRP
jgi:predicted TIM-barrel fold metal-dependent hydrolase